ncbi:MAG: Flp pilus assembly complex ATPase component TadA [Deltaproteobacteria bacterium]|nr:Flp pilus assembly complex ATPase component TadA [Deltaproteobacteria bacterium]
MTFKKIGEILVGMAALEENKIEEVLTFSGKEGVRFGEACIRLGLISGKELAKALALQYGLDAVDEEGVAIDEEMLDFIPSELMHRFRLVPVRRGGEPFILTSDPTDVLMLDNVERIIKSNGLIPGRTAVASSGAIDALLNSGRGSVKILKEAADGFNAEVLTEVEESDEALTIEKIAEDASPVVKLVDTIIYDAISKRASDIHLESGRDGLNVKYRIDGVLHRVMDPVDKRFQASIISRIKVMSELDISERRIPQDGRFKVRFKNKTTDFRVSIMPCVHGEDAVIRILDKEHIAKDVEGLTLESLGFGEKEVSRLRRMIKEPYGMVLVTGPTGSGKTTTLYAAVSEINTGEDKIITIEDPVEYELKGIVQIQVNEKKGLTFARGLRSILRHDPDKIMVGEIRDPETAQIAIQAALTGHLVFTTVHANNVFDVIGRFIHMGIEPYNFVSSLNCVLAQRLIRLICNNCKRPVKLSAEELDKSGISSDGCGKATFFEGAGCSECHNTGYRGRKAVVELLDLNDEIRDMIAAKAPMSVLKKKAVDSGMLTLRQAAVASVIKGDTTLRDINRVTFVE